MTFTFTTRCDSCGRRVPKDKAPALGWLRLPGLPGCDAVDFCPSCVIENVPVVEPRKFDTVSS